MRRVASRVKLLEPEGAMAIFHRAMQLERRGQSIIHLELGEPDFSAPQSAIDAARMALERGQDGYCAALGIPELRDEVAEYLHRTRGLVLDSESVAITPGAKFGLFLSLLAVVEPGDEVLYPDPGFPMFRSVVAGLGGCPVPFSLAESREFQPDPKEIAAKLSPRTSAIILNSPSNPTGCTYSDAVLQQLADLATAHDVYIISDEVYARYTYARQYRSIASLKGAADRTIILDSFSKTFAMTGWRIGYVVVPRELIGAIELLLINAVTCTSEFIQHAALEALRSEGSTTPRILDEFSARRELFVNGLNHIPGFCCQPPKGAFYAWVNVSNTGMDAQRLCRVMLEEAGVAALPGNAFGVSGQDYVRFSFASSKDQLSEALARISSAARQWSARYKAGAKTAH